MLVSYTCADDRNGIISNVLHVSVAQRARRNRGKNKYLDIQVLGFEEIFRDNERRYRPIEYSQNCTMVEVYEEGTGRLIRSWSI